MKILRKISSAFKLASALSPGLFSFCRLVRLSFWLPLRQRLGFKPRSFKIRITSCGKTLKVFIFDSTDFAVLKEIFFDEEYKINSVIDPANIIDLGSNVGYSVLYWKALYPNSTVHAYEPDPETFAKLTKNTEGLGGVVRYNKAISNVSGSIEFFVHPGCSMSSSLQKRIPGAQRIVVASVTLAEAIEAVGASVDLIKFDVEGAEFSVFGGDLSHLAVTHIIGEVHEDLTKRSVADFVALFSRYDSVKAKVGNGRYIVNMTKKI